MHDPSLLVAGTSVGMRKICPSFMTIAPGLASRFFSAHLNGSAFGGNKRSRSAGIRNPGMNRQLVTQRWHAQDVRFFPNSVLAIGSFTPFLDRRHEINRDREI